MTKASFASPVPLPVFVGDKRMSCDVWANGCIYGKRTYDGTTNKVEITPLVCRPGWLIPSEPVGQSYTIAERHLTRLMIDAQQRKDITT